ncbi:hypothetical protein AO501_30395 [Mycobacterium gordonae]|uniref:Transmembrane protein n=1 Tax=Mycobacterium gordonae TaxID=1778 RepID=A0A0Q2R7M5_MYCGO|nr:MULTISPECIES: hypothetical protein [Mycobacterium]KQH80054.1 hypothetical protein AO501_30395 [Mycobacterium gordonae]MDP7730781.1 hypothetical protein [Mycobacterium sp. TY813]
MRNAWRLAAFDVLAPVAALVALFGIGAVLAWPRWWVAVAAALALLIVEGVAINFWLLRRDRVTVGTDDDAPVLRLAVAFLAAVALCAAVLTGYTHWTTKDEDFKRDSVVVVQVATGVAEAVASFSPTAPGASIERAASMMVPDKAGKFKEEYTKTSADLLQRKITAQASTLAAGVEAIGPSAASVAVIMRVTQNAPGQPASQAAPAVRVTLTKRGNDWLVQDIVPINSR